MSEPQFKEHGLHLFLTQRANHLAVSDPGVVVTVLPYLCHTNIRCCTDNQLALQQIETTLQQSLPLTANTVSRGDRSIYWLGPSEWLVVSAQTDDPYLALVATLKRQHVGITSLSGGQLMLTVGGSKTRELLSKGSTLDIHAREFPKDTCAQSTFAKATALIALRDNQPTFELIVRRSFVDYVAQWLDHAGTEFGIDFDVLPPVK